MRGTYAPIRKGHTLKTRQLVTLTLFAMTLAPASGLAQNHKLPFVQAGASLSYAKTEVRILYAAITAREFDLGFTKATLEQVEQALAKAKRSLDRSETLLPENMSKLSSRLLAARENVVAAEGQLEKLGAAVVEQTKSLTVEDEDEAAELPPTDWKLLEQETGWLWVDVTAAASAHAKLTQPLKVKPLKKVRKPRGKRASAD